MGDALQLLLVDDDAFVRQALTHMLQAAYPGAELEEAETVEEALECIEKRNWNLIILDLALGTKSGLAVLYRLSAMGLQVPTLVLTSQRDSSAAIPAFRAGARGFISKNEAASSAQLRKAVDRVLGGGKYVSDSLATLLVEDLDPGREGDGTSLSDQEQKVLFYIASGKSVKEIAHIMELSEKTVRTYRSRLSKKLDLKTDADIVRYALKGGILG